MERENLQNKKCSYRGRKIGKHLLDNDSRCTNTYFKCYEPSTQSCLSLSGEKIPFCKYGNADRITCANRWPEFPCKTPRGTCVNTEGIELFDPIADISKLFSQGVEYAINMFKKILTNDDINEIQHDPQLQLELYNAINSYGISNIDTNQKKLLTKLSIVGATPINTYKKIVYQTIQNRQNRFNSIKNSRPKRSRSKRSRSKRSRSKRSNVHDQNVHDQNVHDQNVHDQNVHDQNVHKITQLLNNYIICV
jgi:uncharacterized phage-associated protein